MQFKKSGSISFFPLYLFIHEIYVVTKTLKKYLTYKYKIITVKLVLSGHSKRDKTKILMTNVSLMKVESIAECSLGAF